MRRRATRPPAITARSRGWAGPSDISKQSGPSGPAPPQKYDVIAVDAFTSDAIPVHLLTRECFEVYFRQLQPGGVLAVHVSNRFLNLVPVVARNAHDFGKTAVTVDDDGEDEDYMSSSDWVLVSGDPEVFNRNFFKAHGIETAPSRPSLRPWTDDYSNLFQILK